MMSDLELETAIRSIISDAIDRNILPFTPALKIMDMLRASGRFTPKERAKDDPMHPENYWDGVSLPELWDEYEVTE